MPATKTTPVITAETLADLPPSVQRYLIYSGVIGRPWIHTVKMKYRGQFRLGQDKPWMPMQAEQVYRTDPPGFQWRARFKMFGLPLLSARDTYSSGNGHMFGKLAGSFTVFDEQGAELLQGTMVRYLQEMVWFPTAYLSKYVTWAAVDDHAADVTFSDAGEQVSGRFYFDDEGRVLSFIADRYAEHDGSYRLATWATPMTEYGMFEGLRVPCVGRGIWQLPEGDLTYIKLRVTDVAYNVPIGDF